MTSRPRLSTGMPFSAYNIQSNQLILNVNTTEVKKQGCPVALLYGEDCIFRKNHRDELSFLLTTSAFKPINKLKIYRNMRNKVLSIPSCPRNFIVSRLLYPLVTCGFFLWVHLIDNQMQPYRISHIFRYLCLALLLVFFQLLFV